MPTRSTGMHLRQDCCTRRIARREALNSWASVDRAANQRAHGSHKLIFPHAVAMYDVSSHEHEPRPDVLRQRQPKGLSPDRAAARSVPFNPPPLCPTQGQSAPPSPIGVYPRPPQSAVSNRCFRRGLQGEAITVTNRCFRQAVSRSHHRHQSVFSATASAHRHQSAIMPITLTSSPHSVSSGAMDKSD